MNLVINDDIYLRNIIDIESEYRTLYKWCSDCSVYKYFEQRILSYEEIVAKYKKRTQKDCDIFTKIIVYKNIPIGLIQYYELDLFDKKHFELGNYNKVVNVDMFIGEPSYKGLGIGSLVIKYIGNYLINDYDCVVLVPEVENINAIKCYEKSGFKKIKEFNYLNTLGEKTRNILMIKEIM